MRSMGTRRTTLLAGATTLAATALTACGTGQVAQTANKEASVYGVNAESSDGGVVLRGLAVAYSTTKGYPAGADAPLELSLYNETRQPVTVTIDSQPATGSATAGMVAASSVGLLAAIPSAGAPPSGDAPSGIPARAEPSGSRPVARPLPTESAAVAETAGAATSTASPAPTGTPLAPAAGVQPAKITLQPLSSVNFRPGDPPSLQVIDLTAALRPGNSVNLVFQFSNGARPLVVPAPMAVPSSPAPRGSAEHQGVGGHDSGGEHGGSAGDDEGH